ERAAGDGQHGRVGGGRLEREDGDIVAVAGIGGRAEVEDDLGGHLVLVDEAASGVALLGAHVLDEVSERVGVERATEAVTARLELLQVGQLHRFGKGNDIGAAIDADGAGGGAQGQVLDVL